jgi:lysophospholipase L1-like esterase
MNFGRLLRSLAPAAAALAAASGASSAELAWVPTWYASAEPSPAPTVMLKDQTIREVVRTTAGGRWVRIRLSNAYGTTPLHIAGASLALRDGGGKIRPGSSARLSFQGAKDVTVAPGAYVLSDPLAYEVPAQTDLAVSLYVSDPATTTTAHIVQRNAVYFAQGEATGEATLTPAAAPGTGQAWLWLDEVEVAGSKADRAVVAFGDSITDGVGPAADTDTTWPDVLYARLRAAGLERTAVINAGLGGNRLLHNGSWAPFGVAGLARFDRDVLAQPNVRAVIVLIGINDIGQPGQGAPLDEQVSAEDLEHGLAQLAERAHQKGLRIYVGTLTPFKVAIFPGYWSEPKDATREAVNRWILANAAKTFDGVVDLSRALEDPAAPDRMRPAYDSGDHLHPNAAGDRAIAEAIPLSWFR